MNILITGGTGLLGKHIKKLLPEATFVGSKDYDLTNYKEACLLISQEEPDWVIHGAAKVGGIIANQSRPNDFYEDNILINTNILKACRLAGVERFTGILSTCAYPDIVKEYSYNIKLNSFDEKFKYPLKEEDLHSGPPAKSNFGYGIAKRALASHIESCNEQYGTKYNYIIPCNLYGEGDNQDLNNNHYVAALLKKIKEAKNKGEKHIELFGTGTPLRQFMYAGDLAKAIFLMITRDVTENFNIATPEVKTIKEIAEIAIQSLGLDLEIKFDPSKPDGQFRKDVDCSKFLKLFPNFTFTSLKEGIIKSFYII